MKKVLKTLKSPFYLVFLISALATVNANESFVSLKCEFDNLNKTYLVEFPTDPEQNLIENGLEVPELSEYYDGVYPNYYDYLFNIETDLAISIGYKSKLVSRMPRNNVDSDIYESVSDNGNVTNSGRKLVFSHRGFLKAPSFTPRKNERHWQVLYFIDSMGLLSSPKGYQGFCIELDESPFR